MLIILLYLAGFYITDANFFFEILEIRKKKKIVNLVNMTERKNDGI